MGLEQLNKLVKTCIVCGREIQWRKKWQNDWDQIKYCSHSCRQAGLTDTDRRLENIILRLLRSRKKGASICPSEAARELVQACDERQWRPLLEPARRAARRLVHRGKISIMQGGKIVDPSKCKGPIRLKLNF